MTCMVFSFLKLSEKRSFFVNNKVVKFPGEQTFPRPAAHIVAAGGMNMKVKHTHPKYESEVQRKEKLQETQRACMAAVSVLRDAAKKHSA